MAPVVAMAVVPVVPVPVVSVVTMPVMPMVPMSVVPMAAMTVVPMRRAAGVDRNVRGRDVAGGGGSVIPVLGVTEGETGRSVTVFQDFDEEAGGEWRAGRGVHLANLWGAAGLVQMYPHLRSPAGRGKKCGRIRRIGCGGRGMPH